MNANEKQAECDEATAMLSDRLAAFMFSLPERIQYSREDLLVPAIKLADAPSDDLVVYDAPFGWVNRGARVALIGVTPGFTQMEIAIRAARRHLLAGLCAADACKKAKYEASFGGSMRRNLVRMLDELSIGEILGTSSASDLFGSESHLLHTTSAIRYPTFHRGRNYTGSRPSLVQCAFLMHYAREVLAPELSLLQSSIFVPLGKSVAKALQVLESEGRIPNGRTLYGFPHPSGANGHRVRQFNEAKPTLLQFMKEALGGS
jgi:hypothetical protein